MNHAALFNGIGGFQLAAAWMGWENVLSCEIDEWCNKVTRHHFPNCIQYGDIKKTDFTKHRDTIDVLSGGFPCQGFSLAGKRLGTEDDRYLWPENLRVIREVRPAWVVGENVAGILSMEDKSGVWREVFPKVENRKIVRYADCDIYEALYTRQTKMLVATICEDLEKEGYKVQPLVIPAASVGAPHKRDRIWFVAHSDGIRQQRQGVCAEQSRGAKAISASKNGITSNASRIDLGRQELDDGKRRMEESEQGGKNLRCQPSTVNEGRTIAYANINQRCHERTTWNNFPTQSPVCSRDDGLSLGLVDITFSKWRNESIKAMGNAIVPQVAYQIFKAIESPIKENT